MEVNPLAGLRTIDHCHAVSKERAHGCREIHDSTVGMVNDEDWPRAGKGRASFADVD